MLFKHLRSRGYVVRAVDKFGHEPQYPVTNNWRHLVQQLHDFTQREIEKHGGEPAFLVGHSLGGFLSLLCAAHHPQLARGVLLLDSPLLGGWKATALGAIKRTQLVGSVSPGRVSRRRKNRWPSSDDALAYFRHKKAFAHFDPQVLHDYITHCTHDEDGERVLSFDRDIETTIYNTLPDNLDRVLQAPSAQVRRRLHRRARLRRDEAGRHVDDRGSDQGPDDDAGRQPSVPDGKASGNRRRDRSRAARLRLGALTLQIA